MYIYTVVQETWPLQNFQITSTDIDKYQYFFVQRIYKVFLMFTLFYKLQIFWINSLG